MAKLGMNADVIDSLATQLDTQASSIDAAIGQIDALISRAAQVWQGADVLTFLGAWQGQYKPSMQRAYDSVSGLARAARNNVADQTGASNTLAGAPGASTWLGRPDVFDWTQGALDGGGLGIAAAQLAILSSRYGVAFTDWGPDVSRNLDEFAGSPELKTFDGKLEWLGVGVGLVKLGDDLYSGKSALTDLSDGAGIALGVAGVLCPPLGLGEAAFGVGTLIGQEITQIPAVHNAMNNLETDAVSIGAQQVGGDVNSDPSAAQRLVERYSGPFGILHAGEDSLRSWL